MSKEELAQQTLDLILTKRYQEILDLLTDEMLRQFPDAVFYLRRGLAYKNIEEFDKAIADNNKAIQLRPGFPDAYHNRGRVWDLKGDYEKAIADYSKAIDALPEDAEYYNSRGVTYDNMRDYDKAMADYQKAIWLNPKYLDAYNNLGVTWDNLGQYKKALDCYSKVIELDPNYHLPYLNRGTTYEHLNQPEKALSDYRKALELKPDFSHAYSSIGALLSSQGKYEEALQYFELAHKYSPYSKYFQKLLDEAKAKLGQAADTSPEETGFSARYVENQIKDLSEKEKKPIRKACAALNEQVEQIRKMIAYKGSEPVVHYTQLRIADIVVMNKDARLRYSNVVFMNDPEEGKVLVDMLLDSSLKNAFERGKLAEDNNIYLGSFLPEDKADYLVMWRTYGKNEQNEEAMGCSITLQRKFFDNEDTGLYLDMRDGDTEPTERQALYHVLYYDKEKGNLVSEGNKEMTRAVNKALKSLKIQLTALLRLKDKKDKRDQGAKNSAINKFVFRYVSELTYFFKSADYQFEKELRVIKYYLPSDRAVKTDTLSNVLPRRLFIESTNHVRPSISKIILGPKVPHPERWMYLEAVMKQNNHDVKLAFSKVKFQ